MKRVWQRTARGQAIVEVSIFGAMVIFLVGSIVSQALSSSFSQNYTLRAMREAMSKSTQANCGTRKNGNIARSVSLLILEDRLSPGVLKFGPTERTPYISSGAGALNKDLFFPMNYGCSYVCQLPRVVIRINGTERTYYSAGFKSHSCGSDCYQRTPQDFGSSSAWKWENKTWAKAKKALDAGGSYACDLRGSRSAPRGQEQSIIYYNGSTCYTVDPFEDSCGNKIYDSADPTQGLQARMTVRSTVDGTLTSNASGSKTTSTKKAVSVICRYFNYRGGTDEICSTLTDTRGRIWSH